MSVQETPPSSPNTGNQSASWLVRVIRFLIRLLLVVILGVLFGVGLYFGVPALYRRIVQPLEQNLSTLNETQNQLLTANEELGERISDLVLRIEALEQQNDRDKQAADEMQSALDRLEENQLETITGLETAVAAADQRGAETSDKLSQALEDTDARLSRLEATLQEAETSLEALMGASAEETTPLSELRQELQLVKVMELLTRSRLFLVQNNLGLAAQDVQTARGILAALELEAPPEQADYLAEIGARLEAALANLPDRPILAAEDLEVAWRLLLSDEPVATPNATSSSVETATPTPEQQFTATPTP